MTLLAIALLGIAASIAQETITWINAKLTSTVLKGRGAFIFSILLAVIGATAQVIWTGHGSISWATLSVNAAQIWAVSQIFFAVIIQWLKLDVSHD